MQKILLTTHPCVIYEAPHRMKSTFRQLVDEGQGARPVVCCRELTKLYEEFKRGTVAEVLAWLSTFGENEVSREVGSAVRSQRRHDASSCCELTACP